MTPATSAHGTIRGPNYKRLWAESEGFRLARTYIQSLIDLRDLSVPEIDAYADKLANEYAHAERRVLLAATIAYLDGWEIGYEGGCDGGLDEAHRFALNLVGAARTICGGTCAALDHIESRIKEQ